MELKKDLKRLESNSKFKEWKKANQKDYFSYAFATIEGEKQSSWQFGYYNAKKDTLTTFILEDGHLKITPGEEVFKGPGMEVKKIDLKKFKLSLDFISKKLDNLLKKDYPNELVIKKIVILQNLEKFGNIWNITCISKNLNVLNVKMNAENGNVIEHKIASVFEFKKE